ncbi:MAG: hypothetical protein EBY61_08140 [Actinobacteria bacterium]|nr:hypothetical protein [Actinomycetota bacterium]
MLKIIEYVLAASELPYSNLTHLCKLMMRYRYNNAVMNLAHSLATACGASEGAAGNWAKAATFVVGGGLAVA